MTDGLTVWGRTADSREGLESQPYEVVAELGSGTTKASSGAALLSLWLSRTSDRSAGQPDDHGRRTFHAILPAAQLSADEVGRPTGPPGELILTLDEVGDPARVELVSPPGGSDLHLVFELAGIGRPVSIHPPNGDGPTSVTGSVAPADVVSAGIDHPVELGHVPRNWVLFNIELTPNSPRLGCSTLHLDYQDADAVHILEDYIELSVTSADCPVADEPLPDDLSAGDFSGSIDTGRGSTLAQVSDGRTAVHIFTDLSKPDVRRLLESLEPFDPSTPPQPLDGLPSA